MPTIKDVSKRANVSVATVSRVINNKGYVNEHTRSLVEKAIAELNYVPNEVARSLLRKSTKTIGILLHDIQNEFFNKMIAEMENIIFNHGYQTLICSIEDDPAKEANYLQLFRTNNISGLIVCTYISPESINQLPNIPIVSLERIVKDTIPSINCDNTIGGQLAARELLAHGCQKVVELSGPLSLKFAADRSCSFRQTIEEEADSPVLLHSLELDFHNNNNDVILQFLKQHPDTDGIFAASDKIAANALKAIKALGKSVPEHIKLIGYDNLAIAELTSPTLTTIAQPVKEMSELAIHTLFQLLANEPIETFHQVLPVKLVQRESTERAIDSKELKNKVQAI